MTKINKNLKSYKKPELKTYGDLKTITKKYTGDDDALGNLNPS